MLPLSRPDLREEAAGKGIDLARLLGISSVALWLLLMVRCEESSSGDLTLRWVWIEPAARALGLHAQFQSGGLLVSLVPLAPVIGLGLSLFTLRFALRSRLGRAGGLSPLNRLALGGAAVGLLGAAAWAGLLVVFLYFL